MSSILIQASIIMILVIAATMIPASLKTVKWITYRKAAFKVALVVFALGVVLGIGM